MGQEIPLICSYLPERRISQITPTAPVLSSFFHFITERRQNIGTITAVLRLASACSRTERHSRRFAQLDAKCASLAYSRV